MLVVELSLGRTNGRSNARKDVLDMLNVDQMGHHIYFFEEPHKGYHTHLFILQLHLFHRQ